MREFLSKVRTLQWDDHRYYHQSRINQTLHLISAISFIVAYALLFVDPAAAGIVGWVVGMVTRQSGHIFSSRAALIRSTTRATNTRSRSRLVTTCAARPS
jgi:hypothetical protein